MKNRRELSAYEVHENRPARQRGSLPSAALLFLRQRCHVVGRGSAAEQALLEQGALHLAMVHFDAPPGGATAATPLRLTAVGAGLRFGWGSRSS